MEIEKNQIPKILEIEKNQIPKIFEWFKELVKTVDKNNHYDFDINNNRLIKTLEKEDQKYFKIDLDEYQDVKKSIIDVFIPNFNMSFQKRKKKKLYQILDSFLDSYKEAINTDKEIIEKIENEVKEEIEDLINLNVEDEEIYIEPQFEVKNVKFICDKKFGKKPIDVKKEHVFNFLENFKSIPEKYLNRDIVANKDKMMKNNSLRYQIFFEKFRDYLESNSNFTENHNYITLKENSNSKDKHYTHKLEKIPDLNKEVVFIGKVVLFKDDLKNKSSKIIMIEYETVDGFNYIISSFNNLKDFFVFSNQMLILKGKKKKDIFYVESIINTLEFTNEHLKKKEEIKRDEIKKDKIQLKMMVIRGSFFYAKLDYLEIRTKIEKIIRENKITLLIILGPIIDYKRKNFKIDNSYFDTEDNFFEALKEIKSNNLKIVYVPDKNELTNIYNIPLNGKWINHSNIVTSPNPSILKFGNLSLAVTTYDLLDEMIYRSKSNFSNVKNNEKELSKKVLKALLETRNLVPLYGEDYKVDPWLYNEMDYKEQPDIFLVNSENIDSFVEKIGDTIFVNFKRFLYQNKYGDYVIIGFENGEKDKKNFTVELFENRI